MSNQLPVQPQANQASGDPSFDKIQNQLLAALHNIAAQLEKAVQLSVTTNVRIIDPANPSQPIEIEAAKTEMEFDGDRKQWIPVLKTENNTLKVYQDIADLHNKALDDSITYRQKAAEFLLDFVRTGKLPE
jgi:hypothetical protein